MRSDCAARSIAPILALLAAVENVFPPVPSDVASLFGGFLAGRGSANAWIVFAVVWFPNVVGALGVYWVGRRYGTRFFQGRIGRMILKPGQMKKLGAFYARRGSIVIFVSRFLGLPRCSAVLGLPEITWNS